MNSAACMSSSDSGVPGTTDSDEGGVSRSSSCEAWMGPLDAAPPVATLGLPATTLVHPQSATHKTSRDQQVARGSASRECVLVRSDLLYRRRLPSSVIRSQD